MSAVLKLRQYIWQPKHVTVTCQTALLAQARHTFATPFLSPIPIPVIASCWQAADAEAIHFDSRG
jgi:hypothetical protein